MNKKNFENLKIGQVIQSKKDNKWAFIVAQNFGDRVVAVRTIEIRDPEEWEVLKLEEALKSEPVDQVKHSMDALEEAAHELHTNYVGTPWYQATGIGDNKLIVYTKRKKEKFSFKLNGIDVEFKFMGKLAPLGKI